VDSQLDFAGEQGLLDLFCEKPFTTCLGKWPVLDAIAGCLDRSDLDGGLIKPVRCDQAPLHLVGLSERQRRSAASDSDPVSLHAPISGC